MSYEAEMSHLMRTFFTKSSNLTGPNQKGQVVLEDCPDNLANNSIVIKHRLSSELTQSLGGSLDMSEGFENSGSFEKNGKQESYSEDLSSKESMHLKKDINEGMSSLEKNQTWSLVRLLARKKALQSKWVFTVKEEQNGSKRLVLSIVALEDLHLEQLDVKIALLHGDLDQVMQAQVQDQANQSLKQGERYVYIMKTSTWHNHRVFSQLGNKKISGHGTRDVLLDHCFYLKKVGSSSIILLLYVDDMLVASYDMAEINKLRRQLSQEFEMKDLGSAKQLLGMSIIRDKTKAVGNVMYLMVLRRIPSVSAEKRLGFSDSDYGGCLDSGKSSYGLCFHSGEADKELVWLKNFLEELNRAQTKSVWLRAEGSDVDLTKRKGGRSLLT
ncbi:putative RNA-directed DNA polymerase [Tanacetum coccineum]